MTIYPEVYNLKPTQEKIENVSVNVLFMIIRNWPRFPHKA